METYREYVQNLFQTASPDRVNNDKVENARVLYEMIFQYAKEKVRIFCNKMAASVFDQQSVCDALENALNRNVRFDIIVQQTPERSKALDILASHENQVRFFRGGNFTAKGVPVNFVIMDECGYRYEYDSNQPCAIGCANDPEFAGKLVKVFDDAISKKTA